MSRICNYRSCTYCTLRDKQCSWNHSCCFLEGKYGLSKNDNLRVCSDYVANLAYLFSHFLVPVDDAVCQGNRCPLSTAIAYASCITNNSNGITFHCRNQGTNSNSKWAVYAIMYDVCGMQYVGQTNNIRSRMNGHKSDYRRSLNGDFLI